MSEYEIISLCQNYIAENTQRFEIFIGAAVAMIIVGFSVGQRLSLSIKSFIILLYSGYCFINITFTILWYQRIEQGIESLKVVTAGYSELLPLTEAIINTPFRGSFNWGTGIIYLIMFSTWVGAVGLMLFRTRFEKK